VILELEITISLTTMVSSVKFLMSKAMLISSNSNEYSVLKPDGLVILNPLRAPLPLVAEIQFSFKVELVWVVSGPKFSTTVVLNPVKR
jgi:hypothetical protein